MPSSDSYKSTLTLNTGSVHAEPSMPTPEYPSPIPLPEKPFEKSYQNGHHVTSPDTPNPTGSSSPESYNSHGNGYFDHHVRSHSGNTFLPPHMAYQEPAFPVTGAARRRRSEHIFTSQETGPIFSSTKQLMNCLTTNRDNGLDFKINAKMDRGFFMTESDWTCYRRNYFQLSATWSAHGTNYEINPNHLEYPVFLDVDGVYLAGTKFFIQLAAKVSNSDKKIDLVQHTAKRDKGPQNEPPPIPVIPGGNLQLANLTNNGGHQNSVATFERIQFKTATANNGKRRAAQQYYVVVVDLLLLCEDNTYYRVATVQSAPLVVRGRSPGHYNDPPNARYDPVYSRPPHASRGSRSDGGEDSDRGSNYVVSPSVQDSYTPYSPYGQFPPGPPVNHYDMRGEYPPYEHSHYPPPHHYAMPLMASPSHSPPDSYQPSYIQESHDAVPSTSLPNRMTAPDVSSAPYMATSVAYSQPHTHAHSLQLSNLPGGVPHHWPRVPSGAEHGHVYTDYSTNDESGPSPSDSSVASPGTHDQRNMVHHHPAQTPPVGYYQQYESFAAWPPQQYVPEYSPQPSHPPPHRPYNGYPNSHPDSSYYSPAPPTSSRAGPQPSSIPSTPTAEIDKTMRKVTVGMNKIEDADKL